MKKLCLYGLSIAFLLTSCTQENDALEESTNLTAVKASASVLNLDDAQGFLSRDGLLEEKLATDFEISLNAVTPSECGATPFNAIISDYNDQLISGFIQAWDGNPDAIGIILDDYFIINQIAALDENFNADTFGANGEFTNYVKNRVRSLEKFWNMSNLISVRGQHTSSLEDLEFVRSVYENYTSAPDEVIDYIMEIATHFNETSPQIPENPLYASDGFATFSRFIVIGDGIVSMLAETGLDPKVVWSSILAHEWAHQMQFLNFGAWAYPVPPFNNTPESTRMTELEADYITAFYLTHKRGGTYNWKRVEDFMIAFFNIGDCGFTSPGHHGTPIQRLAAARKGFELAKSAKKNGHIPPAISVHQSFINDLDEIIGGGGDTSFQ